VSRPQTVNIDGTLDVVIGFAQLPVNLNKTFKVTFDPAESAVVQQTVANPTANNFGTFTLKIKPASLNPFKIKEIIMDGQGIPNAALPVTVARDYKAIAPGPAVREFLLNTADTVNGAIKLEDPWGLTVDSASGRFYVTDARKQRIYGFDPDLRPFMELACPKLGDVDAFPRGLAFLPDQQRLIVVCAGTGKMQVFDASASPKYLYPYGTGVGTGPQELKTPRGACLCPGDEFAVVDTDNCRIQIYGVAGEFKRMFGKAGREGADLWYPAAVAYRKSPSGEDQLVVTDCDNFRVKIYNLQTGALADTIEKEGEGWKFNGPSGVAVDPILGNIFITDFREHNIVAFNRDLKFIAKIGVGKLNGPRGIVVDPKGRLIVADMGSHQVLIF